MVVLLGLGVFGLILTLLGAFLYDYLFQKQELRRAGNMAQDLLQSALDKEQIFSRADGIGFSRKRTRTETSSQSENGKLKI